jgi:hypothetical protein
MEICRDRAERDAGKKQEDADHGLRLASRRDELARGCVQTKLMMRGAPAPARKRR